MNFTLRSKADSLKNLAETISSLTSDNNDLQEKFNDLSVDNKNLLGSLQDRISQVASLKNELESVKIVINFKFSFFMKDEMFNRLKSIQLNTIYNSETYFSNSLKPKNELSEFMLVNSSNNLCFTWFAIFIVYAWMQHV